MSTCKHIQELIPWYVNGTLLSCERALVASHTANCESCREQLVKSLLVSLRLKQAIDNEPCAPQNLYEKVRMTKGEFQLASLDIGSFLLGLSLGLSITGKGKPRMTSNLSLLGRQVSIYDTKTKGGKQWRKMT